MATGEVNYKIKADASDMTAELSKAERSVKGLDQAQGKATKSAANIGKQTSGINKLKKSFSGLGSVVAGLGIGLAFKKMAQNTAKQDAAMAQLNATLKSTEFAAGKTADELTATAAALQKVTSFGDEAIIEMQSLLLTFKDIKGDNFDRTTKSVLDMATAMKTDLKSAAIQLGKALNDPARNLSALTRSGIQFTESQTAMIKEMQAAGDMAGAQAIILKELESQFGGSAKAARETLGGALAGLSNAYGDLFEAESETSASMVEGLNAVEEAISSPGFKDGIQLIIDSLIKIFEWLGKVGDLASKVGGVLATAIDKAREKFGWFRDDLDDLGDELTRTIPLTEMLAEVTVTATRRTEDMAAAVDGQTSAIDELQEVVVVATRRQVSLVEATDKSAAAKKTETAATVEGTAATEGGIKAVVGLGDASVKTAGDITGAFSGTRDLLSAFFFEMAADGKNAFDTLLDGFKAMISKMIAEAATNKIILGISAVAGGMGFSGAASAAPGGGGGFLSTGASLLTSGFSGIGGLYQQAGIGLRNLGLTGPGNAAFNTGLDYANSGVGANLASAGMNIGAGLIGGYAGSQVFGETSGLGATAGGLVGSIYGPVGAGIGSFIGTGIEKGLAKVFGQKNNGDNKGRSVIDLANGTVDIFGEGKSFNDANVDAIGGVTDVIQQFAAVLGGSVSTLNISAGNNSGLNIGNESFGEDTEAFFAAAFDYVIRGAENMDGYMKRLLLTFDGTTDEMILFTQSVVSLNEQIKSNPVDDAIAAYEQAQQSITTIYTQQITTIDGLIKNFDGSAIAAAELNAALISNRQYAYELATAILGLGDQMNAMFASSAQQIRESILTDEEKIAAWTKTRDELRSSLSGILDPAELQATGQEVNRLNSQIFNTLSDDAKLFSAETFARYAEDTGDIVQGQLDMALAAVQTTQEQINSTVNSMLHDTAARMEISTNAFSEAVDKFVGATDKDAETADKNADTAIKGTAPPINGLAVGGGIFTGQNNFNPTTGEFDMTMAEYFQYLKDTGNYVPSGNEVNV